MGPDSPDLPPVDPLLLERFVLPLLLQLRTWRSEADTGGRRLPLIGLNGPVGAGKTSLGHQLEAMAPRFGLKLVVASIDDVYLGWPERRERLAGNPFGVSRVPPGSHDLPLLLDALSRWRQTGTLRLPRFDKSLAAGQGDRAGWRRRQDCDALVLEGWLIGCQPLSDAWLTNLLPAVPEAAAEAGNSRGLSVPPDWSGNGAPQLRAEEWSWLPRWNRELLAYLPLWQACDGFWLLRPEHWGLPRRWRFQAEARQRRAGGGWLTPDALERLVRASLCSLPPALYQDPLTRQLEGHGERFDALTPAEADKANDTGAAGGVHAAGGTPIQSVSSKMPPVQAVAWLDGRRRCRSVWLQPSLSSSASDTG